MQTEQLLCWSGKTDTEHSATSSSNERRRSNIKRQLGSAKPELELQTRLNVLQQRFKKFKVLLAFKFSFNLSNIPKSVFLCF